MVDATGHLPRSGGLLDQDWVWYMLHQEFLTAKSDAEKQAQAKQAAKAKPRGR